MIQITVYGTDIARKKLASMAAVMSPARRELNNRKVGIQLHGDVMRTFIADGATFGRPRWEPLKPSTIAGRIRKAKKGRIATSLYQILRDTGALRQSFVPLSDDKLAGVGAASFVSQQDGEDHADLAPIHQFGALAKNIPARPMLPTEERAMNVMTTIYGEDILRAVKS